MRDGSWNTVRAVLDPAAWVLAGDWAGLVENVEDVRIRLDLTSAYHGDEVVLIDDVRLVPR